MNLKKTSRKLAVGAAALGVALSTASKPAQANPYPQPYPQPNRVNRQVVIVQQNPYSSSFYFQNRRVTIGFSQWNTPGPVVPGPVYRPAYGPAYPYGYYGSPCPPNIIVDPDGLFAHRGMVGVIPVPIPAPPPSVYPIPSPQQIYPQPQLRSQPRPVQHDTEISKKNEYNIRIENSPGAIVNIGTESSKTKTEIEYAPGPTLEEQPKMRQQAPGASLQFSYYYSPDGNVVVKSAEQTKAQIGRMLQYLFDTDNRFSGWSYTEKGRLKDGVVADMVVKNPYGYEMGVFELGYDEPIKVEARKRKRLLSDYGSRTTFIDSPMTEQRLFETVQKTMYRSVRR